MASVNQEYAQAFRTRSYVAMWSKVEAQLATSTGLDRLVPQPHLSESLLEPRRETLADMAEFLDLHPLLVEYFDVTSDACDVYESLLLAVHSARGEFREIEDAVLLEKEGHDDDTGYHVDEMYREMRRVLAEYARLQDPLSVISMDKFRDLQDIYVVLLRSLLRQHHRMNKRTRLSKVCKKLAACTLLDSCMGRGLAATGASAPAIMGSCRLGLRSKKITCSHHWDGDGQDPPNGKPSSSSRGEELDVAAKVLYIQKNDMDTVSRLVGRLQDDVEHGKSRAEMAVSSCITGDLWKGIVKGLMDHGGRFLEQLDELEERICLCLLTINKSRMSVVHEIMNRS